MEDEKAFESETENENGEMYLRAYQRARAMVGVKLAFYLHLGTYLIVNLFLFIVNVITSPQHLWCIWPIIGWGMGLLIHALFAFSFPVALSVKHWMFKKEFEKQINK